MCSSDLDAGVSDRDTRLERHAGQQLLPTFMQVAADVAAQIAAGERRIIGVMVESHLQEGRQDLHDRVAPKPGISITDACIGWHDTVPLLRGLAQAVLQRRARA